jgi:2-keto-3-deoxy-L-fuconate dehydrogenase
MMAPDIGAGTRDMAGRLQGKRCFVTAAGQGIGRAAALAYAAEGASVVATDRDAGKLAGLEAEGIETRALDVLDDGAVAAALAAAGPLDVLFNCAGFVHQGTILDSTEAEWDFAFALNVRSMVSTIRAALPGMIERKRGSIINMSSAASSIKGAPNRCVYGTSKAAVVGLTKSVASDFVKHGVRCNAICPGTVQTPSLDDRIAANAAQAGSVEQARSDFIARQAMGRLGSPEEIAALAVYLGSDETQFITGQTIVIDGGWTL